jgi:hypothetical protein
VALAVFAAVSIAEHLLRPGLDPARHEISEYAHGPGGWAMTAGFAMWAVSLSATAALVPADRRVLRSLLAVAALGMFVTATWRTQTSAGQLPPGVARTAAGRLHDTGSGLTSLALLAAALLTTRATWVLRRIQRLSAAVVIVAVGASVVLLGVGPEVDGVRQRVLLVCACVWQTAILRWPTDLGPPRAIKRSSRDRSTWSSRKTGARRCRSGSSQADRR